MARGTAEDVLSFIERDTLAARQGSWPRRALALAYSAVPLWLVWSFFEWEGFPRQVLEEGSAWVQVGALVSVLAAGFAVFVAFGKTSKLRTGMRVLAFSAALGVVFGCLLQWVVNGAEWVAPDSHAVADAWHCASFAGTTASLSAVLLLLSTLRFGPFPTRRHEVVLALAAASLGLFALTLACPLAEGFHLSAGHFGGAVLVFVVSWVAVRLACLWVMSRKLRRAGLDVENLGRLEL